MRWAVLLPAFGLPAGVAAAVALAVPAAYHPPSVQTAVCPRFGVPFWASAGWYQQRGEPTSTGYFHAGIASSGANRRGGGVAYVSATAESRQIDRACRPTRLRGTASTRNLRPRLYLRHAPNGNPYYVERPGGLPVFSAHRWCPIRGRLVVHVRPLRDRQGSEIGSLVSARIEGDRRLVFLAEIRKEGTGESWFRTSKRCLDESYGD